MKPVATQNSGCVWAGYGCRIASTGLGLMRDRVKARGGVTKVVG
jgi:hypothetical protein